MKTAAIILFVLAGLAAMVAIKNVFLGGENRPEAVADLAGYIVGSFLVPMVLLIIGLVFWNKASRAGD